MGDRYILEVTCPNCNDHDDSVYYAPTCGFTVWRCKKCGKEFDLELLTGISSEDASNAEQIKSIVSSIMKEKGDKNGRNI